MGGGNYTGGYGSEALYKWLCPPPAIKKSTGRPCINKKNTEIKKLSYPTSWDLNQLWLSKSYVKKNCLWQLDFEDDQKKFALVALFYALPIIWINYFVLCDSHLFYVIQGFPLLHVLHTELSIRSYWIDHGSWEWFGPFRLLD